MAGVGKASERLDLTEQETLTAFRVLGLHSKDSTRQ